VPPKLYGGTERVVAWLIDELVSLGHEVTLFASGDSATMARLNAVWPRALRLGRPRTDPMAVQAARNWPSQHMLQVPRRLCVTAKCALMSQMGHSRPSPPILHAI